jgi:pyruvate dehydrogenase E1 component alpha subunit
MAKSKTSKSSGGKKSKEKTELRFSKEDARDALKMMLLIRRFEEQGSKQYGLKKIGGFFHPYIGQEAIAVGAIGALDLQKDYVLAAYRDHGQALAAGMDPNAAMAELYGKIDGCSRGKGGSMHLFDVEKHFYGGNGIVGAHIPVATGFGLRIVIDELDGVVLCFFGEGAIHQGSFHEALNLAKVWKLPVVYICENNHYAMGTHYKRVSAVETLADLSCAYGMPGEQVDGMDLAAVRSKTAEAIAQTREEHVPCLLEMKTYRYMGHSMSDPAKYRTKDELEEHKKQDPIVLFKERLFDEGILDNDAFEAMDQEVKDRVQEAIDFAEESPQPDLETRFEDVLA